MNSYKAGVTGMVVKPNEARARLRLPPDTDPGANQLWGQGQMMPMGSLRKASPKSQQKPATPPQANPTAPQPAPEPTQK